jgi:hypothetical protein
MNINAEKGAEWDFLSGTQKTRSLRFSFSEGEPIALDGGRGECEYISKGARSKTEISASIIDENV